MNEVVDCLLKLHFKLNRSALCSTNSSENSLIPSEYDLYAVFQLTIRQDLHQEEIKTLIP